MHWDIDTQQEKDQGTNLDPLLYRIIISFLHTV